MNDVSFVIVCYNHARYVDRVTWFLRAQEDIGEAEYIFVDDGSTDGTAEAIAAATEGWRNVHIHQQENKGPSAALNAGIRLATRPFTKLVGGDDLLHPQATAILRDRMVARDAVYAFGIPAPYALDATLDDRQYWAELMPRITEVTDVVIEDPLPFMIRNISFNPSSVLLRTEDVQAAGGSDERVFIEDYSMSLRMAVRGRFVHVPVRLAFAPDGDELRLSTNKAQTLHDVNAALAGLIIDHPALAWRYKRMAVKRAAGRGWHWARREAGESVFSRMALMSVLAQLHLLPASPGIMAAACEPFQSTHPIRLPGRPKAAGATGGVARA